MVGHNEQLRKHIFYLFHGGLVGGHLGVHATRHRISSLLYRNSLSQDVKKWVHECVTCQRWKVDNSTSLGLLQPLPIPDQAWSAISMDFMEGLPVSKGKSTILVVVYRLIKYDHFITLVHPFTVVTLAHKYLNQIYKLHGLLESIVSNRDRVFLSKFC